MCLASRAACIVKVADVPLVEAVLVDLACTVNIALVALEWNEWDDFSFFGRICCGAGECVVNSVRSRSSGGGIRAAVNGSSLALALFRGCYWRVYSRVVETDAARVNILEFFFKRRSFSLVVFVLSRFFNIFL